MSEHKVTVEWKRAAADFVYETYNRTHTITYQGGKKIKASNPVQYFGESEYPNPEELLISALSSCYMQTFLAIVCKQGFVLDSYLDNVTGITGKNEQGKIYVTDIYINAKVLFNNNREPDSTTLSKIRDKAHENCFISNTLNSKLHIHIEIENCFQN